MATFPDIKHPHQGSFSQQPMKAQVRSEFNNGAVQSRATQTRLSWVFTLGWPSSWALADAEYQTLVTFFEANAGGKFDYTHWISSADYECQFMEDTLPEAFPISNTHWSLTGLKLYGIEVL